VKDEVIGNAEKSPVFGDKRYLEIFQKGFDPGHPEKRRQF
jgi:hypothetical protein